jgi:hypothetical protein
MGSLVAAAAGVEAAGAGAAAAAAAAAGAAAAGAAAAWAVDFEGAALAGAMAGALAGELAGDAPADTMEPRRESTEPVEDSRSSKLTERRRLLSVSGTVVLAGAAPLGVVAMPAGAPTEEKPDEDLFFRRASSEEE